MQGFTAPGTTSNWRRLRPGTRASSCAAERLALQNISVTAHRAQSPECRGFGVAHKRRGDTLVPTALRGPKHAYGGPEPFGTGAGLLRWQREATALLAEELRAEREKEWKRLRHKLVTMPPGQPLARTQKLGQQQQQPQQQRQQQQQQQQQQRQQQQQQQQQEALGEPGGPGLGGQLDQHPGPTPGHGPTPAPTAAVTLDEETQQRIERSRMKIRFRKFWDLMHERDRPWHYDAVLHLCSRLPPYSCGRYAAVTAGTMQRILARRAKAERVVREQRELARALRRRMAAASLQMSRTGQPISDEWLAQLRRLATQLATGGGNAAAALRQLQGAAWSPYRDQDYIDYVEQLLPLLEETEEVGHVAKHQLLPALQRLRAETARLQATMSARALARDQVLAALASLYERRREPGSAVDPDAWPQLTADEAVEWRYPPMAYWGRPEELRWRLPEQLDGELEQMQGVGQQPWPGPEQGLGGGGAGHGWSGRWSAVSADQGAGEEEERWEEARWEDLTWEEAQREAGGQGPGGWRDVRPTSGSSAWISTGAGGALPGLFD